MPSSALASGSTGRTRSSSCTHRSTQARTRGMVAGSGPPLIRFELPGPSTTASLIPFIPWTGKLSVPCPSSACACAEWRRVWFCCCVVWCVLRGAWVVCLGRVQRVVNLRRQLRARRLRRQQPCAQPFCACSSCCSCRRAALFLLCVGHQVQAEVNKGQERKERGAQLVRGARKEAVVVLCRSLRPRGHLSSHHKMNGGNPFTSVHLNISRR